MMLRLGYQYIKKGVCSTIRKRRIEEGELRVQNGTLHVCVYKEWIPLTELIKRYKERLELSNLHPLK